MGKIKVYARVKPSKNANSQFTSTANKVIIDKKITNRERRSNQASQIQYLFDFDLVFDQLITQTEIFQSLAIDALDQFLEGFNATIFAYGQTGSGKTYTIEGSPRMFEDRGMIPRSISYIYDKLKERDDQEISVHISYFEIYNEVGYDLLNPASRLESFLYAGLPKISIRERGDGHFVTHNLTSHLAADEQIAQHLLLQGSLSRKVASTSMNIHSSRSHAVFTVMLTSKVIGSDTMTVSKLNFVDLAGSERVAKTGAEGKILSEAKFINLSLHYLEYVIIQLQKVARAEDSPKKVIRSSTAPELSQQRTVKEAWSPSKSPTKKRFISYRSSLLTMFLRDSLGGNCFTFMIATLSFEPDQMDESISTCRFAQRVSCIKNIATRNEILDDKALIKKLKLHIKELGIEISELKKLLDEKNNALKQPTMLVSQPLSDDDKEVLYRLIRQFLKGEVYDPLDSGLNTREKILESLFFLKEIILQASKKKGISLVNVSKPPLPKKTESGKITKDKDSIVEPKVEPEIVKEKRTIEDASHHNDYGHITDTATPDSKISNKQLTPATPTDSFSVSTNKELSLSSLSSILARKGTSFIDRNVSPQESYIVTPPIQFPFPKASSVPVSPSSIKSAPYSPSVLFSNENVIKEKHTLKTPITPDPFNRPNQYISPFEQKRRSEISKKIDSLSKSEQDIQIEKDNLVRNQIAIELKKNEHKLGIISSTIENQKKRIKYLSENSDKSEEIENELIAKQRLEAKAKEILCKINELRSSNSNNTLTEKKTDLSNPLKEVPEISSKNTGLILQNLADQQRHQSRIKESIEEMKIRQFEQELELKEAATRRKLLALKQQLEGGDSSSGKSRSLPTSSQSEDRKVEFNNSWRNPDTTSINRNDLRFVSRKESISSQNQVQSPLNTPTLDKPDIKFMPQPPPKQKIADQVSKPTILGKSKSDPSKPQSETVTLTKTKTKTNGPIELNSKLNDRGAPNSQNPGAIVEMKNKLTHEKAYMSAIQANRSRVDKIRRVIWAAEIIQRYWRRYKKLGK